MVRWERYTFPFVRNQRIRASRNTEHRLSSFSSFPPIPIPPTPIPILFHCICNQSPALTFWTSTEILSLVYFSSTLSGNSLYHCKFIEWTLTRAWKTLISLHIHTYISIPICLPISGYTCIETVFYSPFTLVVSGKRERFLFYSPSVRAVGLLSRLPSSPGITWEERGEKNPQKPNQFHSTSQSSFWYLEIP